jgi:hypothetical protein
MLCRQSLESKLYKNETHESGHTGREDSTLEPFACNEGMQHGPGWKVNAAF